MAHTPGPWSVRKAPHSPFDIFDPKGRDIVTVYGGGVGSEEKEANAHLIAAAPELLAALKEARTRTVHIPKSHGRDRLNALLDAAIAKAEGRAP